MKRKRESKGAKAGREGGEEDDDEDSLIGGRSRVRFISRTRFLVFVFSLPLSRFLSDRRSRFHAHAESYIPLRLSAPRVSNLASGLERRARFRNRAIAGKLFV